MVLSMAIFAVEDMFIKQASAYFPTGQIIAFLGLGGAMIFALWSALRREAPLPSSLFRGAALLRSIFEAFATLCFTMALALVPLALFTTVMQANPLLVTLGEILLACIFVLFSCLKCQHHGDLLPTICQCTSLLTNFVEDLLTNDYDPL